VKFFACHAPARLHASLPTGSFSDARVSRI
jgi:hypothetical protein